MTAKYYTYRNLKTGGFSIKYKGKVVAHLDTFTVVNPLFKVNKGGKARCIKDKQRNVHAYIVTETTPDEGVTQGLNNQITYNSYHDDFFHFLDGKPAIRQIVATGYNGKVYG